MRDLAVRTYTPADPGSGGGTTPHAPRNGQGDAPPVLLVHGFCSDGEADWVDTGIAEALAAAGRTVYVPDLPAHGESPSPTASAEVTAPAIAADLVAVLDRAGVTAFDTVGYSLGARIAWELPAAAPGRVERTVLGGMNPGEPLTAVDVDALHRAVREGAEPADPFTGMIAGMVRSQGDRAAGLALCVEALCAVPFAGGAWKANVLPVFVVGENDELTRGIEDLAAELGEARLVTVPGAHHEVLGGADFRAAVLSALSR